MGNACFPHCCGISERDLFLTPAYEIGSELA
jgi:hypothetical protein